MKRSSWNSWINVYLLGVLLSKSVVGQEDSSASTVLATLHDLELQDEIPEDLIKLTGILQSKNFSQIYAIGGNDQRGFSDFAILPPDQPNSEYDPSAATNTRSTIEPLFIRVSILKLQPYEEEMAELLPPSGPEEFQSIEDPVPSYNIDGPEEPILEINEERNQQEQISSKQDGGIMEKIIFQTTDSYVEITNQQRNLLFS
jgi:type III secretion system FlhB-like substrate exporter